MWDLFALSCIVCVLFLTVPGYIFFRLVGLNSIVSLICSPLFAAALYPILGQCFSSIGVSSNWFSLTCATVLVLLLAACFKLAFYVILRVKSGERSARVCAAGGTCRSNMFKWSYLVLYLVIGCVSTLLLFVLNLDGADSFVQEFDNAHHIALVRSFLETGNWSSLTYTIYPNVDYATYDPLPSNSYYPVSWHCLAAMVVGVVGCPITVGINSVNTVFCCIVYSSGMFFLMNTLFKSNKSAMICGAICSLAFAAFPWKLLAFGPIYPNFASLCLLPSVVASFISLVECRKRIMFLPFVIGLVSLVLTQPNTFFTAAAFLAPFCAYSIYDYCGFRFSARGKSYVTRIRVISLSLFCILVFSLWLCAYNLPMLSAVVSFHWDSFAGKTQAVINAILLAFRETPSQIALAICVLFGLHSALRKKEYRWLVCSYAVALVMYYVCASSDGELKQLLTGFWYTDGYRVAANAAFFAMPLATLGMSSLVSAACKRLHISKQPELQVRKDGQLGRGYTIVSAALAICFFFPNFTIPGWLSVNTAFGHIRDYLSDSYSASRINVLSPDEKEFLKEVAAIVPEGALVINQPHDGSVFAYGLYGLNVYYRKLGGFGGSSETPDSVAIRTDLYQLDDSKEVQEAIDSVDGKYLLLLDQSGYEEERRYLPSYVEVDWRGINSVYPGTAGFDEVLRSGDMVLYEITEA